MEQRTYGRNAVLTPTLENLSQQLKNAGFSVEICKGFLAVKYTAVKKAIEYSLHALEMRFGKKIVLTNRTEKGFYVAFSE